MSKPTFYEAANKFGAFFGEPPLPRLEYIDTPVYGFSKEFLAQLEADLAKFEAEEK